MTSTLAVITVAAEAEPLIRWAARFAKTRGGPLTVVRCVTGKQRQAFQRVTSDAMAQTDGVVAEALRTIHESDDLDAEVFALQDPDPVKVLLAEMRSRNVSLVIAGTGGRLPQTAPRVQLANGLMQHAPCDVLLLDTGDNPGESCKRILVPLMSDYSSFALRNAVDMAKRCGGVVAPLWVGARIGADSRDVASREMDLVLREQSIAESDTIKPTVVVADEPNGAILSEGANCDLVLLGAGSDRILRDLRTASVEDEVARADAEPSIGVIRPGKWSASRSGLLHGLLPRLKADDRVALFDRIQAGSRLNADFAIMISLSTSIAALGLLKNSTAVLIGAMLVAPLMTPLIGQALALVQGNMRLFRRSFHAMTFGIACALALSMLISFVTPENEATLAILERGTPDLLDLFVALVSGIAAGYAFSRSGISEVIVGVAIATALVPPLATAGITFASGRWDISAGAAILFITNLVAIVLGAAFVFRSLGVHATWQGMKSQKWPWGIVLGLIALSLALIEPLATRLSDQIQIGQTRPMAFPVSKRMLDAIRQKVSEQPGISLVLAGRGATEGTVDVGILLAANKPVPSAFVEELTQIVRQIAGRDIRVKIIVVQQAQIIERVPPTRVAP
ncbi:MAG: TIGR00341 family protein [Planctomycetes bacterium]|nr:TIGR00341 family protein [Planctomycetota bacterium]